jgi:predicted CoA-substrate-specific enzyme activase
MITAGVDIGSLNTKVVVLGNSKILSWGLGLTGSSSSQAAEEVIDEALKRAEISLSSVDSIISTGVGKKEATLAQRQATEVMCEAKGAQFLYPAARGVIDIGAESCRVVKCDPAGRVVDFALNDRCAAGTGIFLDTMAKALEVRPEEMGKLSLESKEEVNITSMCVVFAESEVVSQIHRRVNKVDILKGIHKSIATRILGMVSRVHLEGEIIIIGGVARNIGVITCLEEMMKCNLAIPKNPQIVGALGAALIAAEKAGVK